MQTAVLLGLALVIGASAGDTPAPDDSIDDKDVRGAPAFSDLERKGEVGVVQVSPPPNERVRGGRDTERRRDPDVDAHQGQADGEFAPEGIKPK